MKKIILCASLFVLSTAALACDQTAARNVRQMIQGMATISADPSGYQRVQWGNEFNSWTDDQKLKMAHATADADACLTGQAREIRFYSPAGKLSAVASPTTGIRLIGKVF
jgi:hypothetical protein